MGEILELTTKIENIIAPLLNDRGYQIYDVEFIGRTLRVSIQRADGTVGIDDCVEVSRLINPLLDVEDVIPGGRYELEVSSPGLDRNLRRAKHFEMSLGSRIHVTTSEPLTKWNEADTFFEKRKNFNGLLESFDGQLLTLEDDNQKRVRVPLELITKAYIDFQLKTNPPPSGSRKKD